MPADPATANSEMLPRPGVIGRGLRLAAGAALLLLAVELLREAPGFLARGVGWQLPNGDWWLLAVASFIYLPRIFDSGFQRRWGTKPQVVALGLLASAAVWDWAADRALWALPLALLVLALMLLFLAYGGVSFLAAGAVATPG